MPADKMETPDSSEPKDIPRTAPDGINITRSRTESEASDKSGPRFILPGTAASPPKVLTFDEVQSAVRNIEDMALAHEIAVNADFKLQPYEPPENSLEKIIKDTMHRAFWDVLKEQLNSTPPIYDHAIKLFGEIKEMFETILTSNNQRALQRMNDILDETVIRQQAEQGILDFKGYANFVIHVMSLACAPVRDEQVTKLREIEDTVETFRAIMETLSVMKLDMANCLLDAVRNDVVANTVEYEKQKFKEYLELVEGLPATEGWLKRNRVLSPLVGTSQDSQHQSKDTIFNAYLELIDWNPENEFPEIISMDKNRILGLQSRSLRICAASCVMGVCSGIPIIGQNSEVRKKLASEILILLESTETNKHLEENIESIWLHLKKIINGQLEKLEKPEMDETAETALRTQTLIIAQPDSPIRSLLWKRFLAYIRLILRSNQPVPVPPGYLDYADEVGNFATAFKRVTYYNYAVYREYYHEMIDKINGTPTEIVQTD